MAILRTRYNYKNTGLLLLRLGIGIMFILHGWPKMSGGPEMWALVGSRMQAVGIDFMPEFWGFMAAFAETAGGALLVLGLFFRPVCILLVITMLVATMSHISNNEGFGGYSHALEAAILFFSLIFIGPGRYSLDKYFFPTNKNRATFQV